MFTFSVSIQMATIRSVLADSRIIINFIYAVHSLYTNITYLYKQFDISARTLCHHQAFLKTHTSTFLKESIHKPEFSLVHIVSYYGIA